MKSFEKALISIIIVILCITFLVPRSGLAQVVTPSAKKRVSIGVGLFTDIWLNKPDNMATRAINQGVQVFGTYNMPFGKSNFSFAIGLGMSMHNLYWNYRFQGDSLSFQFVQIKDTGYKRSKLTLPYFEIPLEFRMKTKSKVSVGVGFKVGLLVTAHAKWVGDDYLYKTDNTLKVSFKGIKNLESFSYGPTLRVGYKWFNLNATYALSHAFQNGTGCDMYPLSVGFVLMPF